MNKNVSQNNSCINGLEGGITFTDTSLNCFSNILRIAFKLSSLWSFLHAYLLAAFRITLSGCHFYCCMTFDLWFGHQSCQKMMILYTRVFCGFSFLCSAVSSMHSNSLSFLRIKNFVTRHLYFPRTRKKKVSSWSGKRLSAAWGTFLQHASVRRFDNSFLMLWENHILNVFAFKTCVLIVKISNFNLLKARFYAALVSFSSSF